MLVNTSKDLSEIADDIHVTEGSIRNAASEIYTSLGVRNRVELIMLLKDKRIK